MRIFFVTNNYTPYAGGVVQSIMAMVNALRDQGHEVFIVTLSFLEEHDDPEYVIRISCPIKFKYKNNYMAIAWRPGKAMDTLIAQYKPDIIHVHHPFLLGAYAVKGAQKYNIPCIFTHHTLYAEYMHYIPIIGTYIKPLVQYFVKNFCNQVDAIIAPSTYVKQLLQAQQITTPIEVIPSPLRKCFTTNISKEQKRNTDFFELLLVTRFVPEKNIPFVFEVMQQLPDHFRLTLVGYGYEYERLQNLAYNTFLFSPHRIKFIHKPHTDQLIEQYQQAYLFIFPSQTDTQGIVLAESMSQGIPVIALDGPGQRDIVIHGVNGFITRNAQETVELIRMLSHNSNLYNQMCREVQKTALHYNPHYIVQKIIDFYIKINN